MAIVDGYCTAEQVRDELADVKDALNADLVDKAVTAASRAVESWCGRPPGGFLPAAAVPSARLYRPRDRLLALVDDIGAAEGLVVETWDGASWRVWATDDYQLEPLNAARATVFAWDELVALSGGWPVGGRRPALRVTARWGWSAVPAEVQEATILRAVALFKRKDAPFGVAGFGDFGALRITRTDADVVALLSGLTRMGTRDG